MSKKQRQTHQKIAKSLMSVFVLAFFLIPTFLTVKWATGVFAIRDPRKVVTVQPLQTRTIDKTTDLDQTLVSVTFDDGWESVYTTALPTLQRFGIPTTQYIISGVFENPSYMSVAQIRSMQKAGHEIAAHTISHPDLTTLSQDELEKELLESRDVLTKNFGPIKDFTSPYGAYNVHTLETVGKFYRSQKNAEGDPEVNPLLSINFKDKFQPLNMKSYSVRSSTTLSELRTLIKAARDNNAWLILTYHQIDESEETFSVSSEDFEDQMLLLNVSNIRVATVSKVLDKLIPNYKREQ